MQNLNILKKLSDNLNLLMAKEGLSANELAKHTNLPATTIKRIRQDIEANPTLSSLQPIAKYFSISISELIGDSPLDLERSNSISAELFKIPHLNWSECTDYELLDYSKCTKKLMTENVANNKIFALTIEDDELEILPKGSIIIVDPELKPNSGNFVVLSKKNQHKACIKKFILDVDQVYLKSLVTGLGIIPLTSEFKILGVVVQYRVDLIV